MESASPPTPSASKWVLGLIAPIFIVSVGVWAIYAMGASKAKLAEDSDQQNAGLGSYSIVSVAPSLKFHESVSLDVEASGVVVPFRQITVAAEVAGRIKNKSDNCQLGRFVQAGEVLFEIDPTDFQWEVERLTALRESEYAQQNELDQEVSNAQRALKLAEQEVALQQQELSRIENLPKGFASATELDQARRALLSSTNQRLTIQNQLDLLSTRRTRVVLAERLASTQLSQAKTNLSRTVIKAPIAGVIVSESVETDSFIQKGATLCAIEDTKRVEVACSLRPDQLTWILDQENVTQNGDQASTYQLPKTPVTVSYQVAGREEIRFEWDGHLSRYEGIGLDPQSRTIPVRITVENPQAFRKTGPGSDRAAGALHALVRGMFVNCTIKTNPKREFTLIPKLALQPGNQVWFFEPEGSGDATVESGSAKDVHWKRGRLKIVKGIKAVRLYRDPQTPDQEYWIVEQRPEFVANTLCVTSPLSSIIGDGSDKIRFQEGK
ncbi:MAG: HlyD family efflux transporter periplasmic adaptor subunit [Pirellulales bacterium]